MLRRWLNVPQPQGKPHLCLGTCLVHSSSVIDFCLGTGDQNSPGIPLTFLRDYGFNGTGQEYPFFMLISFLFKENGPESSVILYNDTTAISQQRQALPLDCSENKVEDGICSFSISGDCFMSTPLKTDLGRAGYHLPGSRSCATWLALPWPSLGSSLRLMGMFCLS